MNLGITVQKFLSSLFAVMLMCGGVSAQELQNKKLPVPRFVSLKSDKVNVRQGPSRDHEVLWIYNRSRLPVEIISEFENWRRIRDFEGAEGWVLQNLLSGKRTVIVAPWLKGSMINLYKQSDAQSELVAKLQTGVLAEVDTCNQKFCYIKGSDFRGYIQQDQLFGVYADELVSE